MWHNVCTHSPPGCWLSRCLLQNCLQAPCESAASLVLLPRRGPKDKVQCCCTDEGCFERATLRIGCKILWTAKPKTDFCKGIGLTLGSRYTGGLGG